MNKRLILIMAVGVCSVLHGAAELGVAERENGKKPARLPKFEEDVKQGDGGEMRSFAEGELAIWKVRETSVVLSSTQWSTHDAKFVKKRELMSWYKAWMQQKRVTVEDIRGGKAEEADSAVQEDSAIASSEEYLSSENEGSGTYQCNMILSHSYIVDYDDDTLCRMKINDITQLIR